MAIPDGPVLKATLERLLDGLTSGVVTSVDAVETAYNTLLAACGSLLEAILAELPDEMLVTMINRHVFRRQTYEELLVKRYEPVMQRLFAALGGDAGQVLDLVNDIHVKMLKGALASFDGSAGPFRAWLKTVCTNHLHDRRRKRRPQTLPPEELPEGDGGFSPAEVAMEHEEEARLAEAASRLPEALACLPDDQRVVLVLRWQGTIFQEIADQMDLSLGKVYQLYKQGLARLRQILRLQP